MFAKMKTMRIMLHDADLIPSLSNLTIPVYCNKNTDTSVFHFRHFMHLVQSTRRWFSIPFVFTKKKNASVTMTISNGHNKVKAQQS